MSNSIDPNQISSKIYELSFCPQKNITTRDWHLSIKIAINGFGRIGRIVCRIAHEDPELEIVAINDVTDTKTLARLFKCDSTHGRFNGELSVKQDSIIIDENVVRTFSETDPVNLPWADLEVDVVLESTGKFRTRDKLEAHLNAGAKKVLLSVPSKTPEDVDSTVVLGVNDSDLKPESKLVSNASCTTNCLAPLVKVIHENFGIEKGLMTTIHSYTNDQRLIDSPHKDPRRARSAAVNIIPTSTGAAKAIGLVIPGLQGKMNGIAVRVPTVNGSLVDLVCTLNRATSVEEINNAIKTAAKKMMQGILEYNEEPLVSTDIIGNPHSCIFDSLNTMMMGDKMVKLVAWYDNEYGYSARCVDLFKKLAVV